MSLSMRRLSIANAMEEGAVKDRDSYNVRMD